MFIIILALILIIVDILLLVLGARSAKRYIQGRHTLKKLSREGVEVYAQITAHTGSVEAQQGRFYFLTISYEYQGKSHSSTQPVRRDQYSSWRDGQSMPIRIFGEHPEVCCLDEKASRDRLTVHLVPFITFSLVFGIFLLGLLIFNVLPYIFTQ